MMKEKSPWPLQAWTLCEGEAPLISLSSVCCLWKSRWGKGGGLKRGGAAYLILSAGDLVSALMLLCYSDAWVQLWALFVLASISGRSISKLFWESHIMKTCQ